MGWASGSDIFHRVAQALISINAAPNVTLKACTELIAELNSEDWDTQHEALQDYTNMARTPTVTAIIEAFAAHDIYAGYCGDINTYEGSTGRTITRNCRLVEGHPGRHHDAVHGYWGDTAENTAAAADLDRQRAADNMCLALNTDEHDDRAYVWPCILMIGHVGDHQDRDNDRWADR